MANVSFVQTDFRGGKWSPGAQGRMHDPKYKTALNVSNNGMPVYNGPWNRRSGFLWGGNTRRGQFARLLDCYLQFSEPFQLELSNLVMRVHVGAGWVFTPDTGVTIKSISNANPAVVTVNGLLPTAWANNDTITIQLNQAGTAPILGGRQYQIQVLSTTTFALYDGITGASIDGSTFTYTAPSTGAADQIFKILELTTPWDAASLQTVRRIVTDTSVFLFHRGAQPQTLTVPPLGNFAIAAQTFTDGPYFNINTTATTLTPGGTSGSITITASSTTGINNGFGFLATDVGRVMRLQTGPGTWAAGTTYNNGALVVGSDNNIYISQVGSNVGHDPTTDTGANWVISGQTVVWVWGYITAVTSTTVCTLSIQPAAVVGRSGATITGDTIPTGWTGASTGWQLGLYSDTTGWPKGGTYFEGRLWLFGSIIPNRVDATQANPDPTLPFNFAPSGPDGTVGDGSAIASVFNNPEINQAFWMIPTLQGILIGTQAGEHIIQPSALGDPITPTSIQIHRVSTYGCANIEPQQTELTTCFVQRELQRVLNYANYPYGEAAGWFADNLSADADDICGPGVAEIRWQQEPSHFLWARMNDGSLACTTFEHAAYGKESYNGWSTHKLGGNRSFVSISTGPSSDGLTTTLYAIALNATSGFYEYLELSHLFDQSQANWAQNFTDGAAAMIPAQQRSIANGDSFNGITLFGMQPIAGQTVTLNMGGLDLGDFVVQSDGHVDVPFTATFTLAFFTGLSNGTNYGVFALPVNPSDPNVYTHMGMGAYEDLNGVSVDTRANAIMGMDIGRDLIFMIYHTGLSQAFYGFRSFKLAELSLVTKTSTAKAFGNADSNVQLLGANSCYHPITQCVYTDYTTNGAINNTNPIGKFDTNNGFTLAGSLGKVGSGFTPSQINGIPGLQNTMIPIITPQQNLICTCYVTGGSNHNNGVAVFDADTMKFVSSAALTQAGELEAFVCPGYPNTDTWFGIGTAVYGAASTTPIGIYTWQIASPFNFAPGASAWNLQFRRVGQVTPANVDATWTHFNNVVGPAFDPTDGNIILYVSTSDVVTHQQYWIKVNPNTAAIVWTFADTSGTVAPMTAQNMAMLLMPAGHFKYARNNNIYTLQTDGSALADVTFPSTTTVLGNQIYWPQREAVIGNISVAYSGSPPGPYDSNTLVPLGTYMTTSNSYAGWGLLTNAAPTVTANWPPPNQFNVPLSVGYNYTSAGQLLRPDFGQDAGSQAGPAFGKKRRVHGYAMAVERSQGFQIGTDNTFANALTTDTVTVQDQDENIIAQPALYTGTLSDTLEDTESWDGQIAWQITRPLPLKITAVSGYLETVDK